MFVVYSQEVCFMVNITSIRRIYLLNNHPICRREGISEPEFMRNIREISLAHAAHSS